MKIFRKSDWMRAVQLISNSAINPKQCNFVLSQCKFVLSGDLHGKNKYGGQGSANSDNTSLKFEVNSTLILPVKYLLTKLEES